MTPLERQELDRLRVENRVLREELAEWRLQDRAQDLAPADLQRVHRLTEAFGKIGPAAWRLLLLLMERPGAVMTLEALNLRLGERRVEDPHMKILNVYVCRLRQALTSHGIHDAIETVWGQGYRLTPAAARALQEVLKEASPVSVSAPVVAPPKRVAAAAPERGSRFVNGKRWG